MSRPRSPCSLLCRPAACPGEGGNYNYSSTCSCWTMNHKLIVYITPQNMDLTAYPSWTDSCPVEREGCQQRVAAVKDEHVLASGNAGRGKMSGAFCLQKDCRVAMGRLKRVCEFWPASWGPHGWQDTNPGAGEAMKKTASTDHLAHRIHSRR